MVFIFLRIDITRRLHLIVVPVILFSNSQLFKNFSLMNIGENGSILPPVLFSEFWTRCLDKVTGKNLLQEKSR